VTKRFMMQLCAATLCLQIAAPAAQAEMSHDEKVAAAAALLGLAAILHNKHHYNNDYAPDSGESTAGFERGYRDAVHGYTLRRAQRDPRLRPGLRGGLVRAGSVGRASPDRRVWPDGAPDGNPGLCRDRRAELRRGHPPRSHREVDLAREARVGDRGEGRTQPHGLHHARQRRSDRGARRQAVACRAPCRPDVAHAMRETQP
jgi:hypothetical protein